MDKLFTLAGTSVLNNIPTYRFATGTIAKRTWVLLHNGHKDVNLYELPGNGMTKEDAIIWLQSNGLALPGTVLPNAKKADTAVVAPVVDTIDQAALDARWNELEAEREALVEVPDVTAEVVAEVEATEEAPKKLSFGERMAAMKAAKKAAAQG